MADVWDGGTQTMGVIKWEFNTDKTAIRFSRTDLAAWPPQLPVFLTNDTINLLKGLVEGLETLANRLDQMDSAFAASCRTRAAAYRTAGGLT